MNMNMDMDMDMDMAALNLSLEELEHGSSVRSTLGKLKHYVAQSVHPTKQKWVQLQFGWPIQVKVWPYLLE